MKRERLQEKPGPQLLRAKYRIVDAARYSQGVDNAVDGKVVDDLLDQLRDGEDVGRGVCCHLCSQAVC